MHINEISSLVHKTAVAHGWWDGDDRNFGELIALMHSELSEALEEWRSGHALIEIYYNDDNSAKPEGIPIEFADLAIRLFDTCEHYGIDLEAAIVIKAEFNEYRPYRHGGKLA